MFGLEKNVFERKREKLMHSKLMSHRFDPPGGWRWKCRFSIEELEMMYCKLFNFNRFEARGNCLFQTIKTYDVRRNEFFGMVRLEDGGMKNLAYCMIEELDWFLFVGASLLVLRRKKFNSY